MMTFHSSNSMPSYLLESTLFLRPTIPWTPSTAIRVIHQNNEIDESFISQMDTVRFLLVYVALKSGKNSRS